MDDRNDWGLISQALAFCGNSLLSTMNQISDVGLDPAFWRDFPRFGDDAVAQAADALQAFAEGSWEDASARANAATRASVELSRLFMGPPKPLAAPWESAYRDDSRDEVGFGRAALEMRQLLDGSGLTLEGTSNQYPDHIGIELLFASHLAQQAARESDGEGLAQGARFGAFAKEHPLAWIDALAQRVDAAFPDGYTGLILQLAKALLASGCREHTP